MKTSMILAGAAFATVSASSALAQAIPFTKHDLYFELNATDGDIGLHGILDGDSWKAAAIKGPGGFSVLRAVPNQASPEFGMTELFFESNEPPLEERSFAELVALFPPGTYQFYGTTAAANLPMRASDVLSTAMPCPPTVQAPRLVNGDLAIKWRVNQGNYNPDTSVCSSSNPVKVAKIQAFFSFENPDTGEKREFSADLGPAARSVEVPDELLLGIDLDAFDEKAEVIVVGADGNRTAIEVEVEL
jgi:hypothetical protein